MEGIQRSWEMILLYVFAKVLAHTLCGDIFIYYIMEIDSEEE